MLKKVLSVFLAILLVSGVFVTTAFADVGDKSYMENESNNSLGLADRLYNDYTVSGKISSKNDIDYFKFVLSSRSKVTFLCISDRSMILVGIANSAGDIIAAAQPSYKEGYYYDNYVATLPAGTYYIVMLEDQDYSYTNLTYMFYIEWQATSSSHTHSYSTRVVAPTCTAQGYTVYTCSCGYSYNGNTKPALGHRYGSWSTTTAATCTSTGTKKRNCNYCSHYETKSIAKVAHKASSWIVDKQGTCTSPGSKHKECTMCKMVMETATIQVAHKPSSWIVDRAATCTSSGTKYKECTSCNKILETATIPATGHKESEWIVDVQSTCQSTGTKHTECTVCGVIVQTGVVEKAEHISTDWIIDIEANCTQKGEKHKECTVCNDVIETVVIDYIHILPEEWVIDSYPNCTDSGSQHKNCIGCGAVVTEAIAPLGHSCDEWTVGAEATCTEDGWKYKECTVCNTVFSRAVIESFGHMESGWKIAKEATCKAAGLKHKKCVVCGEVTETETIAKKAHKASAWITDVKATVHKAGSKHQKCTVCGTKIKTAKIAQLKCATPKLKAAANTISGVKVTWNKVTGADNYEIYRKTGSGAWKRIATVKGTVTTYTDKTAKSGTNYKYTVKAKNEAGLSTYNTSGLAIKFLAAPKLKSVTSAKAGVTFKWNKVTGAQGYIVYRKTGNGAWKEIGVVKGNAKVSYLDKTAKKGVTYKYSVKAYSGSTKSANNTNGLSVKDKY